MRSAYSHIVVALLLCTVLTAEAQRPRTRAEIEALINPSLSAEAAGTIAAEPDTRNLGDIGDEHMVDVEFRLTNTTAETITISELRTSCSCLRVVSLRQSRRVRRQPSRLCSTLRGAVEPSRCRYSSTRHSTRHTPQHASL